MNNLSDNEIIKALECCIEGDCDNCPWDEQTACNEYMKQDALDLINRQKAEIERLNGWQDLLKAEKHSLIKAEAVKKFTARVKEKLHYAPTVYQSYFLRIVDATAKEMEGES